MRVHRVFALTVITMLMLPPSRAFAQNAQGKATMLLAEARTALGGDEKLRVVKTLQAKGEFRRTLGGNDMSGDLEVLLERPDKLRRNETFSFAGGPSIDRTEVLNGSDVWDENSGGGRGVFFGDVPAGGRGGFGGGGRGGDRGANAGGGQGGGRGFDPARIREAQLRTRRADLAQLTLAWFLQSEAPIAWVGTAEAPDGRADVLEMKPADGVPIRLFLDASSHLPLMITWQGIAPRVFVGRRGRGARGTGDQAPAPDALPERAPDAGPPPQVTFQMHLSDYRVVNGIKLPHLITRGTDGQANEEWKISSYKINPSFKSNIFTK